jgi:S1-C subfamily serine protease
VVIEGRRILSNAHLVLYASQIQIEANEAGDKITGTVAGLSPELDLAVIKLDDESFFASHPPLARAKELPGVKDAVMVYGFPTGGSSMGASR